MIIYLPIREIFFSYWEKHFSLKKNYPAAFYSVKICFYLHFNKITMDTPIKRYLVKEHHQPVERICRTLELRDDPELIAEYRRRHSQAAIWPEIPAGIREAGILEMEIYLLGTRLFMIVEVPVGFDWDTAMERLASLPRQQEWEDYMAIFQLVKPGSTAAEKWQPMERIFHLYD